MDSQTCIGLEHVQHARVRDNDCTSQGFGVELHNTANVHVARNDFTFPPGTDRCEIRLLDFRDKIDFSRVLPEAGTCESQPFRQPIDDDD